MRVPLWLRLLQHDHRVSLSEERASRSHLPHFNELHYNLSKMISVHQMLRIENPEPRKVFTDPCKAHLLVKVNKRVVGQLQGLDGQQDGVPVAALYIRDETVDAFHCVE